MNQIIRDMGRDVPPEARDPSSDAYLSWLTKTREEFLWEQELRGRDLLGEYFQIIVKEKTNCQP